MSIFEFDQELHDKTFFEDSVMVEEEKGILENCYLRSEKMKMNQSLEKIAEDLVEESSVIVPFYRAAEKFAPDYDPVMVFEEINAENEKDTKIGCT